LAGSRKEPRSSTGEIRLTRRWLPTWKSAFSNAPSTEREREKKKTQPLLPHSLSFSSRDLKRAHRDRAAWLRRQEGKQGEDDPLVREVASRLVDRLEDCSPRLSSKFRRVLLLGAEPAVLDSLAASSSSLSSSVEEITVVESSRAKLDLFEERAREIGRRKSGAEASPSTSNRETLFPSISSSSSPFLPRISLVHADEEDYALPTSRFDVALSCGGLHWINDLPGLLSRLRRSLAPDGLLLAAVPGGDSLHELRRALASAEMTVAGGVSARVSPMIRMRDAGGLLGRAGFLVPGADVDELVVRYKSFEGAVSHLRGLGESNAVTRRDGRPMRRGVVEAARAAFARICWEEVQREEGEEEGGKEKEKGKEVFKSTFEIFYLTGWAPPPAGVKAPQAAERGSATVSFKELAEATRKHAEEEGERKK